jgi:hypothetical protein
MPMEILIAPVVRKGMEGMDVYLMVTYFRKRLSFEEA